MKKLLALLLVVSVGLVSACGAVDDGGTEEVSSVEQPLSCPQYLYCNTPPPGGYTVFLYSVNGWDDKIACVWMKPSGATKSVTLTKPAECPTCCGAGYCPAQRQGQLTYTQTWICS